MTPATDFAAFEHSTKWVEDTLDLSAIGGTAAAGEVLPSGEVVRYGAGPALVLSFILLGLVCALAGLCYAELAAMIPQAGSAYAYSYATLGELVAWIIGWDLILEYAVGSMTVAIGWSGYMQKLLSGAGITLPVWMSAAPSASSPGAIINLPAVIIVLCICYLLVVGIRENERRAELLGYAKRAKAAASSSGSNSSIRSERPSRPNTAMER